jgi:ribosome assembly protein SQT1
MISHRNVIANTLQIKAYEKKYRDALKAPGSKSEYNDIGLGLLPQSHIYALVVCCHAGSYRGDQIIVLPKFDFGLYLKAISRFKISTLFVVRIPGS